MAALIIAVYVDNNACRFNCIELLEEFEAYLKKDGQIKMLREGMLEWLLGVRYYFDEGTGSVSADSSYADHKPSSKSTMAIGWN